MEARFIYRNRLDAPFYDASKGEMRGGPDQVIVYIDGLLCAMDRDAKIIIPVSVETGGDWLGLFLGGAQG